MNEPTGADSETSLNAWTSSPSNTKVRSTFET
jgi:hypothetical protein